MIVAGPLKLAGIEVVADRTVLTDLFEGRQIIEGGTVYIYTAGDWSPLAAGADSLPNITLANAGQILKTVDGISASWEDQYPDDTGASGKFLQSDGAGGTSWQSPASQLPSQTGNSGKYLTTDGSAASWATLPGGGDALTSGTLAQFAATTSAELAGIITDETGTGGLVFANSPTLITPVLGVATATSINKLSITAPATGSTLAIADGKTLTASNTLTFSGTDSSSVAFGAGGTVAYNSNKLSDFAATTSAELAGIISDETGTGALVFANSPTLVTPTLGAATATSINKVAITAPATGSTLAIADGKTLTASNTLTFSGTDSSSVAFGAGGTVAYNSNKLSDFAATTSAELKTVISDETGSGLVVFNDSPVIKSPNIDLYLDLDEESAPSAPSAGKQRIYAKSDGLLYKKNSAGAESTLGTSGSGAGSLNIVDNPSADTATTGWTSATNYTVSRDTTNSPLAGIIDTCFAISTTTASSETSTSGVYAATQLMPAALRNTKQQGSVYVNVPATSLGVWRLSVYNASGTRMSLSTDSSSVTTLPGGFNGRFYFTFDADSSASYTVSLTQTTRTSANTLYFTNFVIGDGIVVQGAAVSAPVSPTWTGAWSTNATYSGYYVREGERMKARVLVSLAGAPTAANLYINMPDSLTGNTSYEPNISGATPVGRVTVYRSSNGKTYDGFALFDRSNNRVAAYWTSVNATSASTSEPIEETQVVNATSPFVFASGDRIQIDFELTISQWTGSGTVNIGAGAQVQYLYNSSTSTSSDSTSFAYGSNGALVPPSALSANITKRVRSQYPIQVGSDIVLQISQDRVTWVPVGQFPGIICGYIGGNTNDYGMGWNYVPGSTTDIDITFAKYRRVGGTWDSAGIDWSGTYYYRLVIANPSSPVGFGLVTSDSSGLQRATSTLARIRLTVVAGYGSTNTCILRFTNVIVNTGSGITYASSATLGDSFTVTESGIYSFSLSSTVNAPGSLGLSLNSTQLTSSINSITAADRLVSVVIPTADFTGTCSWTGYLVAGDVVRMHGDTTPVGTNAGRATMNCQRIA